MSCLGCCLTLSNLVLADAFINAFASAVCSIYILVPSKMALILLNSFPGLLIHPVFTFKPFLYSSIAPGAAISSLWKVSDNNFLIAPTITSLFDSYASRLLNSFSISNFFLNSYSFFLDNSNWYFL